MTQYALFEFLVVAGVVTAAAFAVALRLLPASWLRQPLGTLLDREGVPMPLRRIAANWRGAKPGGCAQGCCPTGDGCAIGRDQRPEPHPPAARIPLRVLP